MIRAEQVRAADERFRQIKPVLDEQGLRRYAAMEALSLGHGGVCAMSRISGLARSTIGRGIEDIRSGRCAPSGRVRQPGAGRKRKIDQDPTLQQDLKALVAASTRGDPMSPLLWTTRSLRNLVKELTRKGHKVSRTLVGELLHDLRYSLQANSKTKEGKQHIDRDAQFQYIADQATAFLKADEPVISVDTKKKELVGDFKNGGREWHPEGEAEEVRVHDFQDKDLGKAIPYGVYDVTNNQGWVSVGIDHDTAYFATASIRRWWREMGTTRFPRATELFITADGGGSNGYRTRLWKVALQDLADKIGLKLTVSHFPPGTSKWNKVEHRLFSFITQNWRGKPLVSVQVIVNLIAATRTTKGLVVKAALDGNTYETGISVPDDQMAKLDLKPAQFHGEWNYTIRPRVNS